MIILYSIIAIYIAWIWVDYFRLIDIFEKEDLKYLVVGHGRNIFIKGADVN